MFNQRQHSKLGELPLSHAEIERGFPGNVLTVTVSDKKFPEHKNKGKALQFECATEAEARIWERQCRKVRRHSCTCWRAP